MEKLEIPQKDLDYLNSFLPPNYFLGGNCCATNFIIGDQIMRIYHDYQKFNLEHDLFIAVSLHICSGSYNIKDFKFPINMIDEILNNDKLKELILNNETSSEFLSVIKDIIPYYNEFKLLKDKKESYSLLKCYRNILKFISSECLSNYHNDDLEKECNKRYTAGSNTAKIYKTRMKYKKVHQADPFTITKYPNIDNYSRTSRLLQKYFYNQMLEYYYVKECFYTPINDNLELFKIRNINIVTYTYDDDITLYIKDGNKRYGFNSYVFWALLKENKSIIKVDYQYIKKLLNYPETILIVPYDYLDEGFIKYVEKEYGLDINNLFIQEFLDKIGFDLDNYHKTDELLTSDNLVFYKDPTKIEKLKIKDISKYSTLQNLLAKSSEDREKYYLRLLTTYKGNKVKNVKEIDDSMPKALNKKSNKAWWND